MVIYIICAFNNNLSANLKAANTTISAKNSEIITLNGEITKRDQKIQEQAETINGLQATITKLESEIASLGKKVNSLMAQLASALKPKPTQPPEKTASQASPDKITDSSASKNTEAVPIAKPERTAPSGQKAYSIDGLSFNYPNDWRIDDNDKAHIVLTSSHGVKLRYDNPKSINRWAWSKNRSTIDVTSVEKLNNTGSKYPFYLVETADNVCLYTQFPGKIDPQPEPMTQVIFDPVIDNGVGGQANFETNYPAGTSFSREQQDDIMEAKGILKSIRY
jgi:uncharacterized protein YoxC